MLLKDFYRRVILTKETAVALFTREQSTMNAIMFDTAVDRIL